MRPGRLVLRASGGCDIDPGHLIEVYAAQRLQFIAILAGFGPADWTAPTRCAEWSAHEVVRHLCDSNCQGIAPDQGALDMAAGFDARVTPREWLAASDGEPPAATLARFAATSLDLLEAGRARLAERRRLDVRLPYGPVDWTVMMLHGFWDSWIHERDVLLARGAEHPSGDDATAYAAAYGLFIATTVGAMSGRQVQETLTLSGPGGGTYVTSTSGGGTVTVSRGAGRRGDTGGRADGQDTGGQDTSGQDTGGQDTGGQDTGGPPAALVADALAGRGQPLAALLPGLPAGSQAAMSALADYFNRPA